DAGQGLYQRSFPMIDMPGRADDDGLHCEQYSRVRSGTPAQERHTAKLLCRNLRLIAVSAFVGQECPTHTLQAVPARIDSADDAAGCTWIQAPHGVGLSSRGGWRSGKDSSTP